MSRRRMIRDHADPMRVANPCIMVIFGSVGDLTRRLLIPALCNLGAECHLAENFHIVGFARHSLSDDEFRKEVFASMKEFVKDPEALQYGESLIPRVSYIHGDVDNEEAFSRLKDQIEKLINVGASRNVLFYLAIPPQKFASAIEHLGSSSLTTESEGAWRRVIIEKPFGHDLDSARKLNADISKVLKEDQIFRIDHYLGKETVQNLLAFRFANGIFEPIWNRRYIDHVQITVSESLGVEQRGSYYDTAGALRDMVPNHMFQLLSYIAMEPPISLEADAVRDEKAKLLRAVQPLTPEEVLTRCVRGQYSGGVINGKMVNSYRTEADVPHRSMTETYVAMKLLIENWRWAGVPFYLRSGKRLPRRMTEIAIQFKTAPSLMFRKKQLRSMSPNSLVMHIQPEEGISLKFGAKVPGPVVRIGDVDMKFNYEDYFGKGPGTGYETLLYDCMMGDGTLFQRADMVESGWRVVEPICDVWSALVPRQFPNYPAGSSGPREAEELLERDGCSWRPLCGG